MKAPLKWIKEYVDLDQTTDEYTRKMILSGLAVEGVERTGEEFSGVVVGRVESIERLADSDHLNVCMVDVGNGLIQIVTGADNVKESDYVPVALPGAVLSGKTIKKGVLRGVESSGMLCSGSELNIPEGLYPHCGDAGILIFQEPHTPGEDAKEAFGLGDDVIDFEILANRPDCLSIWGIARESAAVLDKHFIMPEIAFSEADAGKFSDYATIQVLDDQKCPRYCARVITNVKIGPSPKWMRAYLHAAGIRPINNIVDITNFVMLETGHPMHSFDLDKVKAHSIVVRGAKADERLRTLDGKEYLLDETMLVIADKENATGLAGIMGGEESEITAETSKVLFECAAFDRTNIRLTSRGLGIRTESSGRFERGICADTARTALERACMLVEMLDCGDIVRGVFDHYPNPRTERVITASVKRLLKRISADMTAEEVGETLERLHIDTAIDGDELTAVIPAYRDDLEGEADLSEELLRLYGYHHIPSTLMSGVTMTGMRSARQSFIDAVSDNLIGMNFYGIKTFSFISPKWPAALRLDESDARLKPVVIRNPLGEDTSIMRTTLVPSMLNTISQNLNRGNAAANFFEIAPVFEARSEGELPNEWPTLILGMYGKPVDFYALKDAVTCLFGAFGIAPGIEEGGDAYYHPGRKAVFKAGSERIAQLGELHPEVAEAFEIDKRVYLAEVNLTVLMRETRPIKDIEALPKFPTVSRDLALVLGELVSIGPVVNAIRKGAYVEEVMLFDIYRGAQVGEHKKSAAFAISFRAKDRTLKDADVSKSMEDILSALKDQFGAEMRA